MAVQDWTFSLTTATRDALAQVWGGFIAFLPKLIGALIVFIVGWFIAVFVGRVITEVLKRLKFDKVFEKTKWDEALEKADFKMKMSGFIGGLIKWVFIIVFLGAAVKILGVGGIDGMVNGIVGYLPNVVVAVVIFIVAVIVADFAEKLMKAMVSKMNIGYVNVIGAIVKWSIWVLAGFTILTQLGVAQDIIQILMQGVVALVVISAALAFGLGGKDVAKDILEEARHKLRK